MSKPNVAAIRAAVPLSRLTTRGNDPILVCGVCGREADPVLLQVWREHDERDQPIAGTEALVFLDGSHAACRAKLDKHPRLYAEETGAPGSFPALCGRCTKRTGLLCSDSRTKANGGEGIRVGLRDPFANAIICGRNGRIRPVRRALDCEGHALPGEEPPTP